VKETIKGLKYVLPPLPMLLRCCRRCCYAASFFWIGRWRKLTAPRHSSRTFELLVLVLTTVMLMLSGT
jgi:hypothetical protein